MTENWRTYTGGQLICDVTLQTFELCLLLRGGDHTGEGRAGALPAVLAVPLVLDGQHVRLRHGDVHFAEDEVFTAGLDEHGEPVEAGLGGGCADLPAGGADVTRAGPQLVWGRRVEEVTGLISPGQVPSRLALALAALLVKVRVPVILNTALGQSWLSSSSRQ